MSTGKNGFIIALVVFLLGALGLSGCAFSDGKNIIEKTPESAASPTPYKTEVLEQIPAMPSSLKGAAGSDDTPVDNAVDEDVEYFFNKPQNKPQSVKIKIFKKQRVLELYGDDTVLGRFKIGLGGSPSGDKDKEGDSKTPVGEYYICTKTDKSNFYLFMGISYPNVEDAQRGLEKGLIDQSTFKKIKRAQEAKQLPPWNTPLGGAVGIHGGGNSTDWTLGCIALKNEDVKILWDYTKLKTPVIIYE
ncbi:MAG: L,D-transpeptidase family protein [Bacillota bacterium]